ncbi:MAG: hypothetical protein WC998_07695, partial [Candidatus Paceibacterota bacterium]
MNLDDDSRFLKENEHREIWNSMISVGEGSIGRLNKHIGTTNAFTLPINSGFTLPTGDFTCIGAEEDTKDNAIIYMLCDTSSSHNHSIMRMFIDNYRLEWILKSEPLLNFQPDYLIISIWRLGDLLGWTDNYEGTPFVDYNPPREINIVKALGYTNYYNPNKLYKTGEYAGYNGKVYRYIYPTTPTVGILPIPSIYWELADVGIYSALTLQILDRIKHPPAYAPTVTFGTDTNFDGNNLRKHLFQFYYRYIYCDNEKSVFSPISSIAVPTNTELTNGDYADYNADNVLYVNINTGTTEVVKIEIAVRDGNNGIFKIIKCIYKFDENGVRLINDSIGYSYSFYNTEVGLSINVDDVSRIFDAVPQISANEKLIEKNRIIDGDYIEGYDNVILDVDLTPGSVNIDSSQPKSNFNFSADNYPPVLNLDYPMYPKSIYFSYGVYTGNPPPAGSYISPGAYGCVVCDFANVPIVSGETYILTVEIEAFYTNAGDPNVMPYPSENVNDKIIGTAVVVGGVLEEMLNQICDQLRSDTIDTGFSVIAFVADPYLGYTNNVWGNWTIQGINNDPYHQLTKTSELGIVVSFFSLNSTYLTSNVKINLRTIKQSYNYPSLKTGSYQQYGIVYYDRALRCGAVNEINKVFIPFQYGNNYPEFKRSYLKWEINHQPPMFAKYFKFVYAKNTSISYWEQCPVVSIVNEDDLDDYVGNYLGIEILSNFTETSGSFGNSNIKAYVWERGDRVRFMYQATILGTTTHYYPFVEYLDFEILGVSYPIDTGSGDTYLKDDLNNYIFDEKGNKIKDPALTRLIIPSFNYQMYEINPTYFSTKQTIVEIYRPLKNVENPIYFETSREYAVINPHTATRYHSGGLDTDSVSTSWQRNQTSSKSARGIIWDGDCYIMPRYMINRLFGSVFLCENSSFSDYYDSKSISIGRIQIPINNARRTQYISNLLYSGMYIENTLTNELSKVRSSDKVELAEKYGEITSIEEVGYTLKVLQRHKPTSLYIGREGLKQASLSGQDVVASKDAVLSKASEFESDYGTSHPGSVCKFERQLYFYDIYSGDILRDAGNGIQSLSKDYKIDAFIKAKSILFLQSGVDNVKVTSCYDHKNNVMFMTFIDSITPGNSFTIGFRNSQRQEEEGFISFYQFKPDFYGVLKQCMTAFKNEVLWIHNLGDTCNFYGTKYIASVKIVSNKEPITVKRFL